MMVFSSLTLKNFVDLAFSLSLFFFYGLFQTTCPVVNFRILASGWDFVIMLIRIMIIIINIMIIILVIIMLIIVIIKTIRIFMIIMTIYIVHLLYQYYTLLRYSTERPCRCSNVWEGTNFCAVPIYHTWVKGENCGQNALCKDIRSEWDSNPRLSDYESKARTTAPQCSHPFWMLTKYF